MAVRTVEPLKKAPGHPRRPWPKEGAGVSAREGALTGAFAARDLVRTRGSAAIRSASCSLAQPRQHLKPSIAVGKFEADFLLITADRSHGFRPDPPIDTSWIEALGR